jgi:hypothetical protein
VATEEAGVERRRESWAGTDGVGTDGVGTVADSGGWCGVLGG